MTLLGLGLRELFHRRFSLVFSILAVAMATLVVTAGLGIFRSYQRFSDEQFQKKEVEVTAAAAKHEDDLRKAMLHLGFNVVILPAGASLDRMYLDGLTATMPQSYADKLSESKLITVRHLEPSLQRRWVWPERQRTIQLIGTAGELSKEKGKKALGPKTSTGSVVLGWELHRSLNLSVGETILLAGRPFSISACQSQKGSQDDISAWIGLKAAQEILGEPGRITVIQALECACAFADLPKVRAEIATILPDTQVIERNSAALARAEARWSAEAKSKSDLERERNARLNQMNSLGRLVAIISTITIAIAIGIIAVICTLNVRQRRGEIGILRAIGLRPGQVLLLMLGRPFVCGLIGGILGIMAGFSIAAFYVASVWGLSSTGLIVPVEILALMTIGAPLGAILAGWLPALWAANLSPADCLREAP